MKPLLHTEVYKVFGGYKLDVPVDVPDQEFGDWKVQTITVTEEDEEAQRARAIFQVSKLGDMRITPVGTYKRLSRSDGTVVMSNTPNELKDQVDFVRHAHGNVLINGLGLGITLKMLFEVNRIERVKVVEVDKDIIDVIGKHYLDKYGDRLEIVHANALDYKPSKDDHFNAVWHDIWDEISAGNIDDMKTLTRKYAKKTNWQASWCRDIVERLRDRKGSWH